MLPIKEEIMEEMPKMELYDEHKSLDSIAYESDEEMSTAVKSVFVEVKEEKHETEVDLMNQTFERSSVDELRGEDERVCSLTEAFERLEHFDMPPEVFSDEDMEVSVEEDFGEQEESEETSDEEDEEELLSEYTLDFHKTLHQTILNLEYIQGKLSNCKNLQIFYLEDKAINTALKYVENCAINLTSIDIRFCKLSLENYEKLLIPMENLEHILVHSCKVTEKLQPQRVLMKLPKVRELHLLSGDCSMFDKVFFGLNNLIVLQVVVDQDWGFSVIQRLETFVTRQATSLKTLILIDDDPNIKKKPFLFDTNSRNQLMRLTLDSISLTDNTFAFIATQKQLIDVKIVLFEFSKLEAKIIAEIIQGKHLQKLELKTEFYETTTTAATEINGFACNLVLNTLHFEEHKPTGNLLSSILKLTPNLRSLAIKCFSDEKRDAEYCKMISSLKHLESVEMNQVNYFALDHLRISPASLKALKLDIFTKETDGTFKILIKLMVCHSNITNFKLWNSYGVNLQLLDAIIGSLPNLEDLRIVKFENVNEAVNMILNSQIQLKSLELTLIDIGEMSPDIKHRLKSAGVELKPYSVKLPQF